MPTLYTTCEAAEILGVTRMTITRWTNAGHFPGAYKIGPGRNSAWRLPADAVKAFDESRRAVTISQPAPD